MCVDTGNGPNESISLMKLLNPARVENASTRNWYNGRFYKVHREREREKEVPRSQKRTEKKGKNRKKIEKAGVSIYIWLFKVGEKWRDKEEHAGQAKAEDKGAGLKTLTKLLNTRVLSPFYIREMKPGRGWKNGKGKRTSIEGGGSTLEREEGGRDANANVNVEERR